MLFNSFVFIIFFLIVLSVLYLLGFRYNSTRRKVFLLLTSFTFYASFHPPFIFLLLASTVFNWKVAEWIFRAPSLHRKRILLTVSLIFNLGALGYYKYATFLGNYLNYLLAKFSLPTFDPVANILLPIGISFYTFQAISYVVDVYARRIESASSYLNFALYLSFFPQLVAGPIVRANTFIPQLDTEQVIINRERINYGVTLIIVGLFIKLVFADAILAPVVDAVFNNADAVSGIQAWYGVLAFSGQIYFDFNGYSSIAIGLAMIMGYDIPRNFHVPYAAIGFTDFWYRWHISLSSWIRDYLYIPLGGSRKGMARTYVNTMLTFLLAGLWHGANILFVIWGLLHAIYLFADRLIGRHVRKPVVPDVVIILITYFFTCIAWVFFRAGSHDGESFSVATNLLSAMFFLADDRQGIVLMSTFYELAMCLIPSMLFYQYLVRKLPFEEVLSRIPERLRVVLLAVMSALVVIAFMDQNRAFIYFQF